MASLFKICQSTVFIFARKAGFLEEEILSVSVQLYGIKKLVFQRLIGFISIPNLSYSMNVWNATFSLHIYLRLSKL